MNLQTKVLEFLYDQLNKKKIQYIRPGMVEDLTKFVEGILSERETLQISKRMVEQVNMDINQKEEV